MRKLILILALMLPCGVVKAQFSTDAPILLKLLANSVSQLTQMMTAVRTARSNLRLLEEVSRGLDDALRNYSRISAPTDPTLYRKWKNVGDALNNIRKIYGSVARTREFKVQRDIDQGIAEAFTFSNEMNEISKKSDRNAKTLGRRSQRASPKGAQRLTAQGVGFLLGAENQSIRTQTALLKLQAQSLARENRKDKEQSRQVQHETKTLSNAFKNSRTNFKIPRF